jgi:tetratricopeptide (TPR) repeat protein
MPFLGALAWAYAELNRPDEARAIIEELRPRRFAGLPRDHTWLITVSFLGRACSRLPDLDAADELYELLLPHRSEIVAYHSGWSGPVSHDLGLLATRLGRYNEADTHFAAAVEVLEQIDSPAWLAHIRIEWGRMLLSRQEPVDAERARKLLDQALATARQLALTNLEQRAVALLQECP